MITAQRRRGVRLRSARTAGVVLGSHRLGLVAYEGLLWEFRAPDLDYRRGQRSPQVLKADGESHRRVRVHLQVNGVGLGLRANQRMTFGLQQGHATVVGQHLGVDGRQV